MNASRGRRSLTLALVVGAVVFGMVLAGGIDLVPSSLADSGGEPVRVTPAEGGLPNFAGLAEAVSPAVVSIEATKIEERGAAPSDPFEFFFGPRRRGPNQQQPEAEPEQRRSDSSGSGFVISADGYIVTNHHVIEDATELTVLLGDREYVAEVKGDDPATDLALLKVEPAEPLVYLELADSDAVRVGDWLMAIGSPLRLQNSVSVGVVSAKGRSINITQDASLENFIQTDAAINFGNSGGPLVDLQGRVIGIATAINFGAENIGFAVPVNTLKTILPQLRSTGVVRRGYLGVNIDDLDFDMAQAFGRDTTDGALVTQVLAESPAEDAGLKHGDIIVQVDDKAVRTNRDLIDYVAAQPPGASVEVRVYRNGDMVTRTVTLGERPGGEAPEIEADPEVESEIEWLGIQFQQLDDRVRSTHEIPESVDGVWVTLVEPTSPLYDQGVRPGDIISEVNGQSVGSSEDLETLLSEVESGGFLRFYISRFNPRTGTGQSYFAIIRKP
ncbi:MAG: Do family serine endopeptidase [Acidobacteriota bacterium]